MTPALIAEFLKLGITGAIAIVAILFGYRKDQEAKQLQLDLRRCQAEQVKLQKNLYEQMILRGDTQNKELRRLNEESNQAITALAEQVVFEEEP